MPWLAPEFKEGKKDSHFKAYKDYGVTELPCLVIVKNDGKTVATKDGVQEFYSQEKSYKKLFQKWHGYTYLVPQSPRIETFL